MVVPWKLVTSPKLTNCPQKMDGWNTTFLFGRRIFSGELLVSGREFSFGSRFDLINRGKECDSFDRHRLLGEGHYPWPSVLD